MKTRLSLMMFLSFWGIVIIISVFGCGDGDTGSGPKMFTIFANGDWQNTVQVTIGTEIIITASGTWTNDVVYVDYYGPEGYDYRDEGVPLPNINVGALIGRIETNAPFLIGAGITFTAGDDGFLQLSMNDYQFQNNDGYMEVTIEFP